MDNDTKKFVQASFFCYTTFNMKRRNITIIVLVLVILSLALLYYTLRSPAVAYDISWVPVEQGELVQTVSETGTVTSDDVLAYGWEVSGRVSVIHKKIGDVVLKGDVIAELENGQQSSAVKEADATVAAAQAFLNRELAGHTPERVQESFSSIAQYEAALSQSKAELLKTQVTAQKAIDAAQQALRDAENDLQRLDVTHVSQITQSAYDDLRTTLQLTITKLNKALLEADLILGVDDKDVNDSFEYLLGASDVSTYTRAVRSYRNARATIRTLEPLVFSLTRNADSEILNAAARDVQDAGDLTQLMMLHVQQLLSASEGVFIDATQATLDGFKNSISTQQTAVATAEAALIDAVQAVESAKNSVVTTQIAYESSVLNFSHAQKQGDADTAVAQARVEADEARLVQVQAAHSNLVAPPRAVDVAALRADVARAVAARDRAIDTLEKTRLVAQADGVISRLEVAVGENVTAQMEIVMLISDTLFVDVDISESDIAKVHIGDSVTVTLDAFGDERVFTGTVRAVEPGETEISGVIYYNTDIAFDKNGVEGVKAGMTANIIIYTDNRSDALFVPSRAVLGQNGRRFVRVLLDETKGKFEERDVTVGLRGDDGKIEILSGVRANEPVITFLRERE